MLQISGNTKADTPGVVNPLETYPLIIEVRFEREIDKWLANLSPDVSWGDRQIAAQKLGALRDPQALPDLLVALVGDPFWMVRCAIILALEKINDPSAIPTLQEVAVHDGFQVVRSYAVKAIERLS
jgi:HEAT repeat protein